MNNPIIKTLLITAFSKLIGDMTDLIGLLYKNETCPVRVDCNAHSVFVVTIGRQNYPSSWDGVRTESDIKYTWEQSVNHPYKWVYPAELREIYRQLVLATLRSTMLDSSDSDIRICNVVGNTRVQR